MITFEIQIQIHRINKTTCVLQRSASLYPELWCSLPLDLKPDNSFPLCNNVMSKGELEMTNKPKSRSLLEKSSSNISNHILLNPKVGYFHQTPCLSKTCWSRKYKLSLIWHDSKGTALPAMNLIFSFSLSSKKSHGCKVWSLWRHCCSFYTLNSATAFAET